MSSSVNPTVRTDNDLAEFDDFGEVELCLKKTIARRTCGS
jgi:hypothetical protein